MNVQIGQPVEVRESTGRAGLWDRAVIVCAHPGNLRVRMMRTGIVKSAALNELRFPRPA